MPDLDFNIMGKDGGYYHLYELQESFNEILKESHILEVKCFKEDKILTFEKFKSAVNNFYGNMVLLFNSISRKFDDIFTVFKAQREHEYLASVPVGVKSATANSIALKKLQLYFHTYLTLDSYTDYLSNKLPEITKMLDEMKCTEQDIYGVLSMVQKPVTLEGLVQLAHANCYGTVKVVHITEVDTWIEYLKKYQKDIDRVSTLKKTADKTLNMFIDRFNAYTRTITPGINDETMEDVAQSATVYCTIAKNVFQAYVMVFAIVCQAYVDRAKNAKQLLAKILASDEEIPVGLSKYSIEDIYNKYCGYGKFRVPFSK